jgi:general secretion pathway protein J
MRKLRSTPNGFTLVELLVAITILAVIGAVSYRGVKSSVDARDRIYAENEYWRSLSRFFLQFEEDMLHSVGRPARNLAGENQNGFVGKAAWSGADDAQLVVAKASSSYQGDTQAATRVGYRLAGNRMERLVWPLAESAPGQLPRIDTMVEGVRSLRLRYMNEYAVFRPLWPFPQDIRLRPNAVEISLTLESGETITRLFSLI